MTPTKIALGSDHHGVQTRSAIIKQLLASGHQTIDEGTDSGESVDYPIIAERVGRLVANGTADRGVLICGSGIGMSIAANKVTGIRAAAVRDAHAAEMSRRHNDANIICLSDNEVDAATNVQLVEVFLATEFDGGRHQRRVDQIADIEGASRE